MLGVASIKVAVATADKNTLRGIMLSPV